MVHGIGLGTEEPERYSGTVEREAPFRKGVRPRSDKLETGIDPLDRRGHELARVRKCRLRDRVVLALKLELDGVTRVSGDIGRAER